MQVGASPHLLFFRILALKTLRTRPNKLTITIEHGALAAMIRRFFSHLFPFVDQRHDYFASTSVALDEIVALLAQAMALILAVPNR
jgi:hypothetical protein